MRDAATDWPGAVDAIRKCKALQQPFAQPFRKSANRTAGMLRELSQGVSADDFRRWRDEAASLLAPRMALLTGFPRSGTTLLEQVLEAHPDLVSSEERDFAGGKLLRDAIVDGGSKPLRSVLNDLTAETLAAWRRDYVASMEYRLGQPIGPRMHLDKNPAYTQLIPLFVRLFPELRLVVALRDPRDVVLSCYLRHLPLNAVSVDFLDVRRTAERYAADMTAWLRFRDLLETLWVEVRYEDTVDNFPREARRALAALGLPWDDAVLSYRERLAAEKRVTSPSYEAVAKPVYKTAVGRWQHYAELLEPAQATLAPLVREFGYSASAAQSR